MNKKIGIVSCAMLLVAAGIACSKENSTYQFALNAVKNKPDFVKAYWVTKYDKSGQPSANALDTLHESTVAAKLDGTKEKGGNSRIPKGVISAVVCWSNTEGLTQISIYDINSHQEYETLTWGQKECQ